METLDQGLATALVLLGIAAMLFGVAALWRSVSDAKAHQQALALDRESHEMALGDRVAQERSQRELLLALIPAGTALLGHWLGARSTPPPPAPYSAPCMGCIPKPPRPEPPPLDEDDDGTIELDLRSLLDAAMELGIDRWLANLTRGTKANQAEAPEDDDDPEPTPSVVPGMS
ncbi:hypothetical protein [Paraliomyxa miuraensis]|uniref:hypothetical protein n=1 Tax=Paraliomyxa miuraensis TaxID=376150 RepID=UPI002250B685|nr:hypothetical protein [Paraliomyxa miuraensis]MCX4244201.1 hypothetical protein [Paraliomyxa miuraensis]